MRKFIFSLLLPAAVCLGFSLTACSSDDDGNGGVPDLPEPAYESSSAKYVMTSGSPYRSIEFTASGNYVIVSDPYYAPASETSAVSHSLVKGIFRSYTPATSRTYFDGIYYGTYTKTGENQYNLSGFGTIVVNNDGTGNAYSITVTPSGGEPKTLSASKAVADKNSPLTDALCRTWKIKRVGLKVWLNGKKIYDKVVAIENIRDLAEDLDDPDDSDYEDLILPHQVIFTKSGTYMVQYKDPDGQEYLDISTWTWQNEKEGVLRYSWNLEDLNDPDVSGIAYISFSGKSLAITEEEVEVDDDETLRMAHTIYLDEVR